VLDTPEELYSWFPGADSPDDITEDFLIRQLKSDNRNILWAATVLLQKMGTSRSAPALRQCCLKPIADVQITSLYALKQIAPADLTEFVVALLQNKKYREKWAAMLLACEIAEATDRPVLERRIKTVTARKRANPELRNRNNRTTEVLEFFNFLERTAEPLGTLGALLNRRREKLTELEIARLEELQ